jgi:hypothetical protein
VTRPGAAASGGRISPANLRAAGYTEYDPKKAHDDSHCVGFFQKDVGGVMLDVSLWRFPGDPELQVNFELLAADRELSLDIGMRGVPGSWTVAKLETYVVALLERVRRPRAARAATVMRGRLRPRATRR